MCVGRTNILETTYCLLTIKMLKIWANGRQIAKKKTSFQNRVTIIMNLKWKWLKRKKTLRRKSMTRLKSKRKRKQRSWQRNWLTRKDLKRLSKR